MKLTRTVNSFIHTASPARGTGWHQWRQDLLSSAMWCTVFCAGVPFWGSLLISQVKLNSVEILILLACHLWLLLLAVKDDLSYLLRAASVLVVIFAAGCFLVFVTPPSLVGISLLFALMLLAVLLVGWQSGSVASILCFGVLSLSVYLSLSRWGSLLYQPDLAAQVGILIHTLLSLLAFSSAIVPLALYRLGSSRAFNQGEQLLHEADQHKNQYQQTIAHITRDYDIHLLYEKTFHELSALLGSEVSQEELFKRSLSLIVECYGVQQAEIYLQADNARYKHTVHSIDTDGFSNQQAGILEDDQVPLIVRQFTAAEQLQQIQIDWKAASDDGLDAGSIAIAWIPLTFGKQTIGALGITKHQGKAFSEIEITALKTYAQLVAVGLLNRQLSMTGQLHPGNISSTNQAIRLLNQADTPEQILKIVRNTFKISTFPSIQFAVGDNNLQLVAVNDPDNASEVDWSPISYSIKDIEALLDDNQFSPFDLYWQADLPEDLLGLLHSLGWVCAAFVPIYQNKHLYTLYVLGSRSPSRLTPLSILPYASLAGYASTTLEKVSATRHLQRRVAALQSLAVISQAISVVTELDDLFDTIHEQITQVIGEIDLAIALYDPHTETISIPYAHEAGEKIILDPFPLGQGLTSILLRSQQPLMIVEDTERRALELGAKIAGASAKSWMGVPLIVSGEIIGAIILQDTLNEQRFDDDDLRLITTLASQVAITIRNIRLLQDAKQRAEKERIISSITTKIWAAPDVETVTRTALLELGHALRASSGKIRLEMPSSEHGPGTRSEDERQAEHQPGRMD